MRGVVRPTSGTSRPLTSLVVFAVNLGAIIALACTAIWAAAGRGYFWPIWVMLGCAAVELPLLWVHRMRGRLGNAHTRVRLHLEITFALVAAFVLIWTLSGRQGPWVLWVILGLGLVLGLHALIDLRDQLPTFGIRELQERVETLSRTRRQVVDAQSAELRRIERDLHDGAQARLVALTMQLGRAEAAVAHEPKVAELVRAAREEANLAIRELRDLARGIAPPVLADRGLVAAVQSLTQRGQTSLHVEGADESGRLPPAAESAAYFLIAEALTNAAKHAPAAAVHISLTVLPDSLTVDVTDDGPGGATPTGTGINGLRARVEALDGIFSLTSPAGGPTHVHAELPCA